MTDINVKEWIMTTDHKKIGILYIITSLYFGFLGGTLGFLIRQQLMTPENSLLTPQMYNQVVTVHGLVMVLWFVSPLAFGLANFIIPLQIGARDLAFPRLNALSYWLFLFSGLLAAVTFFLPGGTIDTGWTVYAPLNTPRYSPQPGLTMAGLALLMLIASVTLGTINFVVTIVKMRAPGLTWSRLPMFTWGILLTVLLMLYAFPSVTAGVILLAVDRVLGTTWYLSPEGGDLLWENLFWFFGHPEVYIVLFPGLFATLEVIETFSGRPLYGRKYMIGAAATAFVLSLIVWGHHMYTTTIPPLIKKFFVVGTMAISWPFGIITILAILSIIGGRVRFKTPMLFALTSIALFVIGGETGIYNASVFLNYHIRGTYWVTAHLHYQLAGATMFGLIAAFYYWFPKITGKMYNEKLGKLHWLVSTIGFNLLYFPMFLLLDMPRRIYTYDVSTGWASYNLYATIGSIIFFLGHLLIGLPNILYSIVKGPPAGPNPWGAWTIEWTVPSPPPPHNFDSIPDLRSGSVVYLNGGIDIGEHHEKLSINPFTLALGIFIFFLGFIVYLPIALIGAVIFLVGLFKWYLDDIMDKYASVETEELEDYPYKGVPKEKLGTWVFLASEILLFGALIGSYLFVRANSASWPIGYAIHDVSIGFINTIILLTSSLSMALALAYVKKDDLGGTKWSLAATFLLGLLFLIIKSFEWSGLYQEGFTLDSGLPAVAYYTVTGAHAAHVMAGLFAIAYLILKTVKGGYSSKDYIGIWNVGLYWHMVDIVWVFLFPLFYLI